MSVSVRTEIQACAHLPNDLWPLILADFQTQNPLIASVCKLFWKINHDQTWIVNNLNKYVNCKAISDQPKNELVDQFKKITSKRLVHSLPQVQVKLFNTLSSPSYYSWVQLLRWEEDKNLTLIFKKLESSLSKDPGCMEKYKKVKEQSATLKISEFADLIRTFLNENQPTLSQIECLDLSLANLTRLPASELNQFTGVKKFSIYGNLISFLPETLGDYWPHLKSCDVSGNRDLTDLPPPFMEKWKKLEELKIRLR